MEILLPKKTNRNWQKLLSQIAFAKPMKPFNARFLEFIQEISDTIMDNREFLQYPEIVTMAQWMREEHLKEIYRHYESRRQNKIWLPRGVVLHFAPSNVDSLFIYSWFLSLLVGNINIIRLSQDRSTQVKLLLAMLNSILGQAHFKTIRERNLIVSYGHEETITKELSNFCNVRVIWGGDETIRQIRAISLPPRATELVFADRFSMAAFKADAILNTPEKEIDKLAENFYNDAFLLNQKACSSAKLLFWIGEEKNINRAKEYFWSALKKVIYQKKIHWDDGVGITRMITGYRYAAEGLTDKLSTAGTQFPYRVHVRKFKDDLRELHCGGGFMLEAEKPTLMDVVDLITLKDQTLAVYGFSKDELEEFAWQLGGYGIDRIVQIGQALNFQVVWDGYDMLTYFTREVTVM